MTIGNKVAAVTLSFWLLKVLATTLGETSGDLLAITLNLGYLAGLAITSSVLAVLLLSQLASPRFHALTSYCSGSLLYSPARSVPPSAISSPSQRTPAGWPSAH